MHPLPSHNGAKSSLASNPDTIRAHHRRAAGNAGLLPVGQPKGARRHDGDHRVHVPDHARLRRQPPRQRRRRVVVLVGPGRAAPEAAPSRPEQPDPVDAGHRLCPGRLLVGGTSDRQQLGHEARDRVDLLVPDCRLGDGEQPLVRVCAGRTFLPCLVRCSQSRRKT